MAELQRPQVPLTPPQAATTTPGSVGWLLDDPTVKGLIDDGVKVRVKAGKFEPEGQGQLRTTRLILSTEGKTRFAGRRLAEVAVTMFDLPQDIEVSEMVKLTVFGPNKRAFHRERLFDGPVGSREEALEKLRELVPGQVSGERT